MTIEKFMQTLSSAIANAKAWVKQLPARQIGFWAVHGVLILVLLASSCYLVACSIIRGGTDGIVTIGSKEYICVAGDYMAGEETSYEIPTILEGDLIVVKKIPTKEEKVSAFYADLKKGDIVKAAGKLYRIDTIEVSLGVYTFSLACDNSVDELTCTSAESVIEGVATARHIGRGNTFEFIRTAKWLVYVCIVYDMLIVLYSVCIILFSYRKIELDDLQKQVDKQERQIEQLQLRLRRLSADTNYTSAPQGNAPDEKIRDPYGHFKDSQNH